jgi:hypothetical protein
MPVVEKVKKPVIAEDVPQVAEELSIEKPRTRKPPTEAMKEAGRKNLEKGRLALQEKRKAAISTEKQPTPLKINIPPIQETVQTIPSAPRPRSRKVIYQEESDSEDEVIIVKKKKKPAKKVIYQDESEDEQPIIKKKSIPAVEYPPSPPRYVQPSAVIRWI